MVAVGQKQSFRGVDDDHGRQGVEGPGVALDPRGVEVSFGVDRRGISCMNPSMLPKSSSISLSLSFEILVKP
jgi:hypothetical protein